MTEPLGCFARRRAAAPKAPWPRRVLGYGLRIVIGVFVGFILINLAVLLLMNVQMEAVEHAQRAADRWALVLFLVRLIVYGAVWHYWTPITVWFARRHHWRRVELRRVLEKRPEIVSYFVLLELVISGSFLLRIFP